MCNAPATITWLHASRTGINVLMVSQITFDKVLVLQKSKAPHAQIVLATLGMKRWRVVTIIIQTKHSPAQKEGKSAPTGSQVLPMDIYCRSIQLYSHYETLWAEL